MIYISPTGSFNNPRPDLTSNDAEPLVKVQIENSLALGWKKEDILLFTNFDFEYGVIKANVLKDVVQEFLWLKPELKNKNYKAPIHEYLKRNNFPFAEGVKIGLTHLR